MKANKKQRRIIKWAVFVFLLATVLPQLQSADAATNPSPAEAAHSDLSATNELEALQSRADKGDLNAQFELAWSYDKGEGVPQDYVEAAKWYRKAAEQGEAAAQYNLGWDYDKGEGVPQDYVEAAKWYRKAAEQGDAKAKFNLGVYYAKGRGVPQDDAEAAMWYRKAAEQGNKSAQLDLGFAYYFGEGVPQDSTEAVKWFRKAAEQGEAEAQSSLASFYYSGEGVPQDYAEAVNWYRKAAEQGNKFAQRCLGRCYELGRGVPKDNTEAVKWFRKAAEQGEAEAQISLASSYYFGEGVPHDYTEAAKWFRKAAEQGDGFGQYMLGCMYHFGQGVPEAYVEAYKWYNLAAAQDETNAIKNRDTISHSMTPSQIAEGQRQASAFVAKKEGTEPGGEDALPRPEIVEGKVFAGTGFFVTDDGYLVTCEHVVHGAVSFHVKTASGSIRATLVTKDAGLDIALLKVSGTYPALPLDTEAPVKLGDSVFTIGFPNTDLQGVAPKLTKGDISSLAGIHDNPRYFQISVPVQPGNSGGALVDERGNVVGVVTSRLNDVATYEASGALPQNVNYAVKGGLVYSFLNKIPELSGKLKAPRTAKDQEAANAAAEHAAVLVIAE